MKKRNIIVCAVSILIVMGFIAVMIFESKEKTFTENGITYALIVDGVKQSSFPSKGMYRVDTNCINATCKWDYEAWKLYIEDITGDVLSDITFTTIPKNNFNDYILSLSGTTQGTGEVVHETFNNPIFTNSPKISQTDYGETSQYSSTGYWQSTGTTIMNAFSFNSDIWVSNPSNMTSNTYYNINFTVPGGSYYQMCYEMSAGNTNNMFYLYEGSSVKKIVYADNSKSKNECINLGYASSVKYYRVGQRAYDDKATIKFYLTQTSETSNIDTGYRYEGKNPNNYVLFNNELWRIIGVMNEGSHGQTEKMLIKIVRDNALGGLIFDKTSNDWSVSSLNGILNNYYYKSLKSSEESGCLSYYYYINSTSPSICDFTYTGIKNKYQKMIENVNWFLGNLNSVDENVLNIYLEERVGNNSTSGYIGLIYTSDYGFSALQNQCRSASLSQFFNLHCGDKVWISESWGLNGTSTLGTFINNYSVQNVSVYNGNTVRPTLYLNENVYVLDGDGSITDPYIIGMD